MTGNGNEATLTAIQNEDKTSSITLNGFAAGGAPGFWTIRASTSLILEITNDDIISPRDVYYEFTLSDVMAELKNGYGPNTPIVSPQDGSLGVSFGYQVRTVGGTSPTVAYNASYDFWTYSQNDSGALAGTANIDKMSGTPTPIFDFGPKPVGQMLQIDELSDSVYLGRFIPGETKEIEVVMQMSGAFSEPEHEFDITMGDPGAVPGNVRFEPVGAAMVPLPASFGFLLAGLGTLGAVRTRRTAG